MPITAKSDVWMLGCVAYMLLYRKHPFEGKGELGIITGFVEYPDCYELSDELGREGNDQA